MPSTMNLAQPSTGAMNPIGKHEASFMMSLSKCSFLAVASKRNVDCLSKNTSVQLAFPGRLSNLSITVPQFNLPRTLKQSHGRFLLICQA